MIVLLAAPAFAWGHHYLVTDRALSHPSVTWADEQVEVEPLSAFIEAEAPTLQITLQAYQEWMEGRKSKRFAPQGTVVSNEVELLAACRLNPTATFPLVVRLLPGAEPGERVDPATASKYLKPVAPLVMEFAAVEAGDLVSARSIVDTFTDEPDWGFDHELWVYPSYGYGEIPYGKLTGESSKAAFHMQFAHENLLVKLFAHDVTEGMVVERVELFLRLSRVAFDSGHRYWGYRFAAWAAHYVQDLAQPYHSKALPGERFGYYVKYAVSEKKDEMKVEATQLAANRHFIYEDVVAYGLQQSYLEPDPRYAAMSAWLSGGEAVLEANTAEKLAELVMKRASKHAPDIDAAILAAADPRFTDDPSYDVETAPDYSVAGVLAAMPAPAWETLLEQTGQDFATAGAATRTLLALARGD